MRQSPGVTRTGTYRSLDAAAYAERFGKAVCKAKGEVYLGNVGDDQVRGYGATLKGTR
jgi:hypothetical protein